MKWYSSQALAIAFFSAALSGTVVAVEAARARISLYDLTLNAPLPSTLTECQTPGAADKSCFVDFANCNARFKTRATLVRCQLNEGKPYVDIRSPENKEMRIVDVMFPSGGHLDHLSRDD